MKTYFVEQKIEFVDSDSRSGKVYINHFECNAYEFKKDWTGNCIRLIEANTVKEVKGKEVRKERKTGVYITVDLMPHWKTNIVNVIDNDTCELIYSNCDVED